jgi:hypothetical protein
MSLLPAEDTARRHWLQRIPHYQRPASNSGRAIWLTPSEQSAIAS